MTNKNSTYIYADPESFSITNKKFPNISSLKVRPAIGEELTHSLGGQFYVTLTSSGIKEEGQEIGSESDREKALEKYGEALTEFVSQQLQDKKGAFELVFRNWPEVKFNEEENRYRVFSRLLIREVPKDEK